MNNTTVYVVWLLDEHNNQWTPVSVGSDYDEAMEYVYEREDDYDCQFAVTKGSAPQPEIEEGEEE